MRILYFVLILASTAYGWEMDLFDLVEEVNQDFYALMGVERNAEFKDIRQAFKKLSLQLHPDKNDSPDAEVSFRQLVDVYNILKEREKRERYDDILEHGLPDWRHAVYYYRRVRKMGLLEMLTIVFIIVTVGQYITAWAAYWEKIYTINEYVETQKKRLLKKQKKGKIDEVPDMVFDVPQPSVKNTLPFQLPKLAWYSIVSIPLGVRTIVKLIIESRQVKEEEAEEVEEVEETWVKGPRRRRGFVIPEGRGEPSPVVQVCKETVTIPTVSGGLWTDDDLAELIKLVNKHPPGTSKRWEKVAEALCRPVAEVIHMSKKVKEGLTVRTETAEEPVVVEKVKTRGKSSTEGEGEWSSAQQKALEEALIKFPKQASERWERIAK